MAGKKNKKPRCAERVSAGLFVKIVHKDMMIYGITSDLSRDGMCIETGQCLHGDADGDIIIPVGNEHIRIPFMVRWNEVLDGFYDRMGVKLKKPPRKYCRFVETLKSSAPL
jgi:hypothetical protein